MKIGLFSDLHLKYKKGYLFSKVLIDGIKVLNQIFSLFDKEKVELVLFLGDLFDRKYSIDVPVYYALSLVLEEWKRRFSKVYFLLGNHDIYKNKINSIEGLRFLNWKVIKEKEVLEIGERKFTFFPYRKEINKEEIEWLKKQSGDFLLLHQLVKGFPVHSGITIDSSETIDCSLLKKRFNFIFSGHSHVPYREDNVINIGAPMKFQFGEVEERGAWILDGWQINFYKLDYPEFYTIKGDSIPEDDDYNYYRIITSKNKNLDKKENIEIIFSGNEVKKINRLGLGENWDLVEAMEKCVKLKKVGKDYLEFGKRFILEKESE